MNPVCCEIVNKLDEDTLTVQLSKQLDIDRELDLLNL